MKVTWTARNNSSFLNGVRESKTTAGAVRAARRYIREELYGDGKATIYIDGEPIRTDECSMLTRYKWEVKHM